MSNIAILLAAGQSKRFKADKLFTFIEGKPIIFHSLKFLEKSQKVDAIYIAANAKNKRKISGLIRTEKFRKVKKIFLGGKTRFESATRILYKIFPQARNFLPSTLIFHNAANPFATAEELANCIKLLKSQKSLSGVAVGRKIHTTIKKAADLNWTGPVQVKETIPRQNLWAVETPQVVHAKDFLEACRKLPRQKFDYTDDLSVLEAAGFKTAIIDASPQNRKITAPADLEKFFSSHQEPSTLNPSFVGIGEDSHKFRVKNQVARSKNLMSPLMLGGVKIKNMPQLEAQSDGDVILHALCNAISSALGGGSLGTYATKIARLGIRDSKKYLREIFKKMRSRNLRIHNCAISIEASRPKIDPLAPRIKKSLSALLQIPAKKIGITATSGEKLTPFGKGEAIRCSAIVILSEQLQIRNYRMR